MTAQPRKHWIKRQVAITMLVCSFGVLSSCSEANVWALLGKDFTGRVLDKETREPIEGAYVIAIYSIVRSGMAATTTWCVKTKGMYTGKDGRYNFPIAGLNGLLPNTSAIKSGYFLNGSEIPSGARGAFVGLQGYQGWDIYLQKQNPEKLEKGFWKSDAHCTHAGSREDVDAGLTYLKFWLKEYETVLKDTARAENMRSMIVDLEALSGKK